MSLNSSSEAPQLVDSVPEQFTEPDSTADQATDALLKLGGVPLERFADPSTDFEIFQAQNSSSKSQLNGQHSTTQTLHDIPHLNQLCQRTFNNLDALNYAYLEDYGPLSGSQLPLSLWSFRLTSIYRNLYRKTVHLDHHAPRRP